MKKLTILLICVFLCLIVKSQTSPFFNNAPIDGPDAPQVQLSINGNGIQVDISTMPISNNFNESFASIDTSVQSGSGIFEFQGYIIYQIKDTLWYNLEELYDTSKTRVIAQTDIQDNFIDLTNHYYDTVANNCDSLLMVQGNNQGIQHSFQLTNDVFTNNSFQTGTKYCFQVIAYAANSNKTNSLCNNKPWPFLMGFKNANGTGLTPYCIEFNPTNIIENEASYKIIASPNPSLNHLNFSSEIPIKNIEIIDLTGKIIESHQNINANEIKLNISNISPGLYCAKIQTDLSHKSIKFLKK